MKVLEPGTSDLKEAQRRRKVSHRIDSNDLTNHFSSLTMYGLPSRDSS